MNIFKVIDGNLIHIKKETVNTGSKRFFKVQFDFDETWQEYTNLRFVEFYQNINGQHYKVNISNSNSVIANIPTKVLKTNLPIYVAVIAENYDSSIVANTNFLPIAIRYGANTQESFLIAENEDLFQLYAPDTSVRYLRLRNKVLEYSSDKINWEKVSSAVIGGVSEERLEEVVNETLEQAKQYTDNEIATFDFVKIVDTLPEIGLPNREYFVRKESADTSDLFDEYAWINKGTKEEPNYGWEFKGTKIFEIDLSDYVKFTDYASNNKAGITIFADDSNLMNEKTGKNGEIPYVPSTRLSFAVKRGLTNGKTTYTDEEKASACETIGAVKKQTPTSDSVYIATPNGDIVVTIGKTSFQAGTMVQRDKEGCIHTNSPTKRNHATPKWFVEELIANLQAQIDELKGV